MKAISLYIIIQFLTLALPAEAINRRPPVEVIGDVELSFRNVRTGQGSGADSVLVIFDRFDLSGAGVIYKVFYMSTTGSISITGVPEGKYYVTIRCLGVRRDRFEKVIRIRAGKLRKMQITLQPIDQITREEVFIPTEHIDCSRLMVCSMK